MNDDTLLLPQFTAAGAARLNSLKPTKTSGSAEGQQFRDRQAISYLAIPRPHNCNSGSCCNDA